MKTLALAIVLGAMWHGSHKGTMGTMGITGTIVQTRTAEISLNHGVVVVNIDGHERWGFYNDDVLAITVGDDSITHFGGQLVWAGEPEVIAAR